MNVNAVVISILITGLVVWNVWLTHTLNMCADLVESLAGAFILDKVKHGDQAMLDSVADNDDPEYLDYLKEKFGVAGCEFKEEEK